MMHKTLAARAADRARRKAAKQAEAREKAAKEAEARAAEKVWRKAAKEAEARRQEQVKIASHLNDLRYIKSVRAAKADGRLRPARVKNRCVVKNRPMLISVGFGTPCLS